jgi:hypothetical protein
MPLRVFETLIAAFKKNYFHATYKNCMKKLIAFSCLFFVAYLFVSAQFDENILPKSFKFAQAHEQEIILPKFNLTQAEAADLYDAKDGTLPKISRTIETNISPENSGTWTVLADGSRIWKVKITSNGALGLIPLFDKFYLPEGSLLHVYTNDREEILGAFTHSNSAAVRSFCPGLIHDESCVIEYYEPISQKGKGIISISGVGHAYRWVSKPHKNLNSGSGSCEVNVTCPEAASWQDQKRSVVMILVVGNSGQGYCSGALVNNVRQDCTPYLLSAQHCTEGGVTAAQYNQWVFYFNYEATSCSGTSGPLNKTVNGCTKVAESNDNGGDTGSDFLLLQLSSTPSSAYNVYYSGWDHSSPAPTSGVGIHHPNADIKKISAYSATATSTSWGGSVSNTHWEVIWTATTSGHGVTEPGSSGSPLYNQNGLIVGHLTGGNSCCTSGACGVGSGLSAPDDYGKLYYDWSSDGATSSLQLKPWLDPDNTGATTLAGTNAPCGSSVANDAGIQNVSAPDGSICTSSFTPTVLLRNYGSNSLTSVLINYTIDGNVYQYQWSGNLAAGGTQNVTLPSVTVAAGAHTFSAETLNPNGTTDGNTANDLQNTTFTIVPPVGSLNLNLHTDSYGSETTWDIKDNNNNIVASGGPFGDVTNGQQFNIPVCIAPGCYTFTIRDSYGDGMSGGGNSSFQLTGSGGTPVYATLTSQSFGYSEAHSFCVTASGISEVNTISVRVIPNPSTGVYNVSVESDEEKTVRVFNGLGQLVYSEKTTAKNFGIDLSQNSRGIYMLQVESKNGKAITKLVLK